MTRLRSSASAFPSELYFYDRLENWPLNDATPSHLDDFGDVGYGKSLKDNWTVPVEETPQPVFYKQLARKTQPEVYAKILTGPANQPLTSDDFDSMVPDYRAVDNWRAARSKYADSGLQKDYDEMIRWVRPYAEGYDSEDGLPEPGRGVAGRMEDRRNSRSLGRYWHRKDNGSPARPVRASAGL